jgi:hypothetical protein
MSVLSTTLLIMYEEASKTKTAMKLILNQKLEGNACNPLIQTYKLPSE